MNLEPEKFLLLLQEASDASGEYNNEFRLQNN